MKELYTHISAGRYKGKKLKLAPLVTTRSTKSILKESYFNTIQFDIVDSLFFEVFGGSGTMGFEALSRGAKESYFIEIDKRAYNTLYENAKNIDERSAKIFFGDSFLLYDEILGYKYRGIINCDRMSAYKEYTKYLQRCWAHILRETKELAEKHDDVKLMHQWMKDLFAKVKFVSVEDLPGKRKKFYNRCIFEMTQLIQTYSSYQHIKTVITKINNGLEFWFAKIMQSVH